MDINHRILLVYNCRNILIVQHEFQSTGGTSIKELVGSLQGKISINGKIPVIYVVADLSPVLRPTSVKITAFHNVKL